jgi:hypothetical protein
MHRPPPQLFKVRCRGYWSGSSSVPNSPLAGLLPPSTYDCRSRGRNLSTRVCPSSYWLTKILERRNSSYPVNLRVPLHSPNDSIHSSCLMRATVAVMPQRDRLSSVVPLCSCSSGFECDSNATSGRMARAAAMQTWLSGLCLASSRSSITARQSRRSRCSSWCYAVAGRWTRSATSSHRARLNVAGHQN